MTLIKHIFTTTLICFVVLTSPVLAIEFGMGVSFSESDHKIYIPIVLKQYLKAEVSIGYSTYETSNRFEAIEETGYEAGIGLFCIKDVYQNTQLYFGTRLSYLNTQLKLTDLTRGESSNFNHSYYSEYGTSNLSNILETESDGYIIAPTLGIEYFFSPHISLGAETAFRYTRLDTDDRISELTETMKETDTRLILRCYF